MESVISSSFCRQISGLLNKNIMKPYARLHFFKPHAVYFRFFGGCFRWKTGVGAMSIECLFDEKSHEAKVYIDLKHHFHCNYAKAKCTIQTSDKPQKNMRFYLKRI
ncbi:hypothetical protein [Methanolapillus africanus]|uniref:hypothetical protein n=1 Tax=Methanolapillus africanus TaxID=3028297 RepID=UPI0030B8C127